MYEWKAWSEWEGNDEYFLNMNIFRECPKSMIYHSKRWQSMPSGMICCWHDRDSFMTEDSNNVLFKRHKLRHTSNAQNKTQDSFACRCMFWMSLLPNILKKQFQAHSFHEWEKYKVTLNRYSWTEQSRIKTWIMRVTLWPRSNFIAEEVSQT